MDGLAIFSALHSASLEALAADAMVAIPAGLTFPLKKSWGEEYCFRILDEAQRGDGLAFVILHDDSAAGCVRFFNVTDDGLSAELGIWLARRYQRKGRGSYASPAFSSMPLSDGRYVASMPAVLLVTQPDRRSSEASVSRGMTRG